MNYLNLVNAFAMCLLVQSFALASASEKPVLEVEVFVSEPTEVNVTSVLVIGPTEMMVVSAQGTKSAANRLADLIETKERDLKYVFLTHPHFDHYQGASVLKQRFPDAKFVTAPSVGRLQRLRAPYDDQFSRQRFGDNAAVPSVPVEDYAASSLTIDNETIEIWKDIVGDAGFGYPDEPHLALYIPSLHTLIPSDVVYFDAHVFMGGSSPESRRMWIEQIDSWLQRDFERVIPGHMPRLSMPSLTANAALAHTRDYIHAYDTAIKNANSSDALIAKMLELYPNIKHQQGLYLSAFFDFYELRTLGFNEKGELTAGPGPRNAEEARAQRAQFEEMRRARNL